MKARMSERYIITMDLSEVMNIKRDLKSVSNISSDGEDLIKLLEELLA
jgi:hypothetical protein